MVNFPILQSAKPIQRASFQSYVQFLCQFDFGHFVSCYFYSLSVILGADLKTVVQRCTGGSNPSSSADFWAEIAVFLEKRGFQPFFIYPQSPATFANLCQEPPLSDHKQGDTQGVKIIGCLRLCLLTSVK